MVQFVMGQLVVYGSVLGGKLVVIGLLPLLLLVLLLMLVLATEELDREYVVVGLLGSMPTQYDSPTQKFVPQSSVTSGFQV